VIERVPEEVKELEKWTGLASYCFEWGEGTLALALGYGSLYNHSYQPNARYDDPGGQSMVFTAIEDIAPGDEITINYNAEPLDQSPVGFKVITTAKTPRSTARLQGSNGQRTIPSEPLSH